MEVNGATIDFFLFLWYNKYVRLRDRTYKETVA